jgi:hypothetical protein
LAHYYKRIGRFGGETVFDAFVTEICRDSVGDFMRYLTDYRKAEGQTRAAADQDHAESTFTLPPCIKG